MIHGRQGAANLKDVLKNIPGILCRRRRRTQWQDQVILRGFAAFNDLYRDGQRDVAQYKLRPVQRRKIEVLRAPARMFGRARLAGVINQVSKAPLPANCWAPT